MKRFLVVLFALGVGLAVTDAIADETVIADAPDEGDTISRRPPPAVKKTQVEPEGNTEYIAALQKYQGRQYPALEYLGADWLSMDVAFVHDCRSGLEMIYLRDYKGAKKHFDQLGQKWRGLGISPVGQVLIWQALMLENFDFRYEPQYQNSYRRARQELEEALVTPGNDAWENFLMAGMLGIDSIHTMRHEEYMKALSRGYEAMKSIEKAKELAPDFKDTQLGDGLFNYWVTVISKSSKAIPDIGDRREQGIQQMTTVERQGLFLRAPATLALTFTWIEEGNRKQALVSALRNAKDYPDNIVNNLVLGRVYMYNKRYTDAENTFKGILSLDPGNLRAHFYLGRLYLRWRKYDDAMSSLDKYLAFKDLSDYDRGVALYYRGNVYWRLKQYDKAEEQYRQAWKVDKLERAKKKMERAREKQKQGK